MPQSKNWVKVIKPEEDFKNRYCSFNAKSEWAWDHSLQKNFLDLMATIPDDYPRATLIESSNPDEYSPEPASLQYKPSRYSKNIGHQGHV